MPARVIQLIRHAPMELLKEYFSFIPATSEIDWQSNNKQIIEPLLNIIDDLKALDKKRISNDVERILTMIDELGQSALSSVVQNRKIFHAIENNYQKSLWTFLYDYEAFEKAEDIRHADIYLKDSTWDGFIGPQNINIIDNLEQIPAFEMRIKDFFNIDDQVKIEIFNRYLSSDYRNDSRSFQVIIHYEGSSVTYKKFKRGEITYTTIHPIEELVIIYDPNSGQINIISKDKKCKKTIAKAFVETLLRSSKNQEQVSLLRYNLDKFRKPYDFITLPEDGIELVKVMYLLLQEPHNLATFAIDVPIKQKKSIYEIAEEMFKTQNPLRTDCRLIRATILIRFKPNKTIRSNKLLSTTIARPNTCKLESNSLEDRQLINKYLKIWELTEEL